MSLKFVHLIFIIASTLLAGWVAAWCFMQYGATNSGTMLAGAVVAGLVAAGLIAYAFNFVRKFRNVRYY